MNQVAEADPQAAVFPAKPRLRPAAPVPHTRDMSQFEALREFGRNIVAAFGDRAYREKFVYQRSWIQDFMLLTDPDGIKHVLLDNADNYIKSKQTQLLTGPALGNGMFNAEGLSWRTQRRTSAHMFSPRSITDFAPDMTAATEDALARWEQRAPDSAFDAAEEMMRLTFDIISRTIFSNDVTMPPADVAHNFGIYLDTLGRVDIPTTLGLPLWVPTPKRRRGYKAVAFFRKYLTAMITRRREQLAAGTAPKDFLTLLLTAHDPEGGAAFTDEEVYDNAMTFVLAGHETTANALSWTLYLLSQFPDWDARVAEEVKSVLGGRTATASDVAHLPVTRMVLEESMRLYPPAPMMARDSINADTICGVEIRPRTNVVMSPWILHRHRTLWDDPDYFDPERFAPGRREKIHRFAYLPFGAGPRICIGMGFAMQEAMIVLASIMQRWRMELEPGHPVEVQAQITARPKYGLKMRLIPR